MNSKTTTIINIENDINCANTLQLRTIRRKLRYKMFRIREGKWQQDSELKDIKEWIETQFENGWTFSGENGFTFAWDLSVKNPLKIISPFEWDGTVQKDQIGTQRLDPSAFTRQH